MVAVTSINGKLTKGDDSDIYKWTSVEDHDFFFSKIKDANLIVMGSGTYEAIREDFKTSSFSAGGAKKLRVVITKEPEKYINDVSPGELEFTSETPTQIVRRFENKFDEMLLAGGGQIFSLFAAAGLINEIYLTIEPKAFGKGKPLFAENELELNLKLESFEKLNEKGTMLLKYQIIK